MMKTARALLVTLIGLTLAGCESAESTAPDTMVLQPRATAVVGDVVYVRTGTQIPEGSIVIVKSYTGFAEPYTCSTTLTSTTFTGTVTAVVPGFSMGQTTFDVSAAVDPGTKLRVSADPAISCSGSYIQAAIVQ